MTARSSLADFADDLHLNRHALDLVGQFDVLIRFRRQVDLQAEAIVVQARDPDRDFLADEITY